MVSDTLTLDLEAGPGNIAIAFVNSLPDPLDPTSDSIATPVALEEWLAQAPFTSAAPVATAPEIRTLWNEAHRLRPAIRRLFEAVASQQPVPPQTLHTLNRAQELGRWTTWLSADAGGLRLHTALADDAPVAILCPIARAAAELATTVSPARLRECAAETCARWFIDTSKGGRRRWCSMARCGNRSKAARYRARQIPG